ncbi:hypothetical protein [Paraclostridium dentum]|uniref:hypothetical protein n=1 Tax=Paraclostridium dentum TaxID=2662455 RepID=UPI003F400C32
MYQNADCNNSYKIAYGNSLDVTVGDCESEIRADITVDELNSVRLWGQIVNCDGKPVPNALIKLVKVVCNGHKTDYVGVAHTITDCEGFYQFELCNCPEDACYRIIVSKAAYGPERIISGGDKGNCDPCDNSNGYPFDPCEEYEPFVTPAGKCSCTNTNCTSGCQKKTGKY